MCLIPGITWFIYLLRVGPLVRLIDEFHLCSGSLSFEQQLLGFDDNWNTVGKDTEDTRLIEVHYWHDWWFVVVDACGCWLAFVVRQQSHGRSSQQMHRVISYFCSSIAVELFPETAAPCKMPLSISPKKFAHCLTRVAICIIWYHLYLLYRLYRLKSSCKLTRWIWKAVSKLIRHYHNNIYICIIYTYIL